MKSKILFGIFIILAIILSASIVCAGDLNATEVDEVKDHRLSESDMEKLNSEYEVIEAEADCDVNMTKHAVKKWPNGNGQTDYIFNITIKDNYYHDVRSEVGSNYDMSGYGKNLNLGVNILDLTHYEAGDNLNDSYIGYKKVCVILHGLKIVKEPVYKTITKKSTKTVFSHYKKIPHYKKFKSWDFAKSPKKLKKMIKSRCYDNVFECCPLGTTKLVKFYQKQLYKNGAKLVKFKIKRLSKYKYSPQHGYKVAKFKFSVKVKYYTLKPVYKMVTVKSTSKVFSHYKKIGEIW